MGAWKGVILDQGEHMFTRRVRQQIYEFRKI